jgi:quinolinate synthase
MGLNSLENLEKSLIEMKNTISVSEKVTLDAQRSLNRMTSF